METKLEFNLLRINKTGRTIPAFSTPSYNIRNQISIFLMLTDVTVFLIATFGALASRVVFGDAWRVDLLPQSFPVILMSLMFFGLVGLYPAIGMSAVEELRKLTTSVTVVVFSLAAMSFWLRNAEDYSRLTLSLTWAFSLVLLPLGRDFMRTMCMRLNIWGEPVVLIGYGEQGKWAFDFFRHNRKLGLNPTIILDFSESHLYPVQDVQVIKTKTSQVTNLCRSTGLQTALVILSEVPADVLKEISRNKQCGFQRLIMIPSLEQISSYGVMPFDFGGVLGFEIKHNLLDQGQQALKRIMDIGLVLVSGLLIFPALIIIGILIKLDSKGSLFYGHSRIGKGGYKFKAWKFRTMDVDADAKLQRYLNENPQMRAEWETAFKLKCDPRITRLGKILRRFSIDELPQLVNVLKGEMSLVGPRPIVDDEIQRYGNIFDPYTWVRPGITGLWQVSGRSNTSYVERVRLDEYYIRNWSIWLDVYIMARTIGALLRRDGAY